MVGNWVAALSLAGACASVSLGADLSDFLEFNYDLNNNGSAERPGRLFVPTGLDPAKSYPLVIFFHGAGQVGTNNTSQVTNSSINNLLAAAKSEKFFLYAPQTGSAWSAPVFDQIAKMVGEATRTYAIDSSKVYTTGLSLGGGAVWDINAGYRGVFAAGVPIASGSGVSVAPQLVDVPLWAYHARNDANSATPVGSTRNTINAIRQAKGKSTVTFPLNTNSSNPFYNTGAPYYSDGSTFFNDDGIRYSEYATGGHGDGTWGRAYAEAPMYDWLLAQSRTLAKPQAGEKVLFDLGATQQTAVDAQGRTWNGTTYNTGLTINTAIPYALTSAGVRTGIHLDVTDKFDSGDSTAGVTAGSKYAADVASDGWAVGTYSHSLALAMSGVVNIRGLAPNGEYRIELFASQSDGDGAYGKITRYTIGDEWRDLNVHNNLDTMAIFQSVFADANGVVQLSVGVSPDSNSRTAYLSAIELTAVPEPALMLAPAAAALTLLRRRARPAADRARSRR